jgi:acyl carrier protein
MALAFEDFAGELASIVEEAAGELTPERELLSIPLWDSLAVVTVMALASDKYDRILEPDRLVAAVTIGDLFALITNESKSP